jgi:lysophospholipase L1-like esterase
MPVIDHGLPAYGTNAVYGPADGNSGTYGTGSNAFRCSPPCSLIIDLSSVPAVQRQQDFVSWYDDASLFYAGAINNPYYNEPRDYTIDGNTAPGGGPPPTTGWTTLASVSGNFYDAREQLVTLSGANWIRMNVTAVNGDSSSGNTDAAFNLDINDASQGLGDTWLFLGDSITAAAMDHREPSNFMQQVQAADPPYFPSEIDGGVGGWTSGSPLGTDSSTGQVYIDELLSSFPSHFVALDYGTNDADQGGTKRANFSNNMTQLINKVLAAGKIPIIPRSIPWGCTSGIQTNGPTINADLQNLLKQFPQALPGADFWSYFSANQSEIGADCIHPTSTGDADYRTLWFKALQADGVWSSTPLYGLVASGSQMVDYGGQAVLLHGVNRSGTEYACIHGWGMFDGPSDASSIQAMASWHINIVRVPLNEDCWLGINGVDPAYSGQNYIHAITSYVKLLHQYGMYAELSLMWGAPGTALATYQSNAPDEDHSPAMWASMAQTFENDPNVILAPWGEATVQWSCFLNGCTNQATYGTGPWDGDASCGSGCWFYTSAGMQQAVDVMRQNGYTGPIAIPCIGAGNVCADPSNGGTGWGNGNWLQDHPTDPNKQLLAEAHMYGGLPCDTTPCLNLTLRPILEAHYPVILGETGETYNFADCPSTTYIQTFLTWAEQNKVGTEAWAWDTWGSCSSGALISDYSGIPEDPYGSYVQSNYQTTFPPN